jgi:hypothetical protein
VTVGHKVYGDKVAGFQTLTLRMMTILTELQCMPVRAGPMARFMRAGF